MLSSSISTLSPQLGNVSHALLRLVRSPHPGVVEGEARTTASILG